MKSVSKKLIAALVALLVLVTVPSAAFADDETDPPAPPPADDPVTPPADNPPTQPEPDPEPQPDPGTGSSTPTPAPPAATPAPEAPAAPADEEDHITHNSADEIITEVVADGDSLLDEATITAFIEDYLASHNVKPENIGIGFCYTETGEQYYYNPDFWVYSASLYKVPLMMVYAERVQKGEMSFDDVIGGYPLKNLMRGSLVESNNEMSMAALVNLSRDEAQVRNCFKPYAPALPLDYYDPSFDAISNFSPRFMTHVMYTLYQEPERFPMVTDYLLQSLPDAYYRTFLGDKYDIAQKYGSYDGANHASAIIYTPHPIVVTVMTIYTVNYLNIIGEIGELLANYTLETVDPAYEAMLLAAQEPEETEEPVVETPEPTPVPTPEPTEAPEPAESGDGIFSRIPQPVLIVACFVPIFLITVLLLKLYEKRR